MGNRSRFALAAGLAALALSACGSSDGNTVQGAKLISKGEIVTCTHLPYPPFQSG